MHSRSRKVLQVLKIQQGPADPAGPAGQNASLSVTQTAALNYATVLSNSLPFPAMDAQRRGCPACHTLVDKATGKYTLAYEAHERAEAGGLKHPDVAPDGTSITATSDVNVKTCLECHAPGTGAREVKGKVAPLMLRDIVHLAHMGSQTFKLHYGGQCFTCHDVDGQGNWLILTEKVDVNDKGVPNPDKLPIPGALSSPPYPIQPRRVCVVSLAGGTFPDHPQLILTERACGYCLHFE